MGLHHGRVLEMSETLREVPSDFRQTRLIGRLPFLSGVSRSTGFAPLKDRHRLGLAGLWSCVLYPRLGRVPPGTGFCYGLRL